MGISPQQTATWMEISLRSSPRMPGSCTPGRWPPMRTAWCAIAGSTSPCWSARRTLPALTAYRCSRPAVSTAPSALPRLIQTVRRRCSHSARSCATIPRGRRALLIASTDLSHYHDAATAAALDRVVIDCVARFDADALQAALDARPDHACGGGPTVAVMRAARLLGARDALVLDYADSGDVSGDKSAVVGYLAAAFGTFENLATTADTEVKSQA